MTVKISENLGPAHIVLKIFLLAIWSPIKASAINHFFLANNARKFFQKNNIKFMNNNANQKIENKNASIVLSKFR